MFRDSKSSNKRYQKKVAQPPFFPAPNSVWLERNTSTVQRKKVTENYDYFGKMYPIKGL